jgi:hypothetical protein
MTVADLIQQLKGYPPNTPVSTWDPFRDEETDSVRLSRLTHGWRGERILITNCKF